MFGDERLTLRRAGRARPRPGGAPARPRGAGPETLVGVFLERSLDMLVAVLGVMASGAAYVPLDPEYPEDRIGYMVESSGLPLLVIQAELEDKLPEVAKSRRIVRIDADREAIAAAAPGADGHRAASGGPESLAYVIYTSGSTGKPKGVQVAHRSVVNFLRSMAAEPGFGADDRLLAVTTLSFDIAGLELYLPLVTGGTVVIAARETAQAGELLLERTAGSGATVMQATPATWRLLLDAGWQGPPPAKILCGGEALPRELADRLLAALRPAGGELWNMYGPTETTIWSSVLRVTARRSRRCRWAGRSTTPRSTSLDPALAAGAGGRAGRAVHRRPGPGPRLPGPRRRSPPSASCPIRSPRRRRSSRGRACTAPATWCAGARTAPSPSWAGSTTRSRCAASASSWARSRASSAATRRWSRRW